MEKKSFLGGLFDLSFSEFIIPKIIKVLFIIAIAVAGIITIIVIASSFASSIVLGVVVLILSPIIFLLYVLLARIYMEILIVIFRIQADIAEIKHKAGEQS